MSSTGYMMGQQRLANAGRSAWDKAYNRNDPALTAEDLAISFGQTQLQTAQFQLQQQQQAWEIEKQRASQNTELGSNFLKAWTSSMGDVKNIFNQALGLITQPSTVTPEDSASTKMLTDLLGQIQAQYTDWQKAYGGLDTEIAGALSGTLADRQKMQELIKSLTTPDYEGVAAEAGIQARQEAAKTREDIAREALSYGIDPSSGKFGALTRRTALEESKNVIGAMNQARQLEKQRIQGTALGAVEAFDPTVFANLMKAISDRSSGFLGTQADIAKAISDIEISKSAAATGRAQAIGNIAGGYASAILNPLGDFAGYYLAGGQ